MGSTGNGGGIVHVEPTLKDVMQLMRDNHRETKEELRNILSRIDGLESRVDDYGLRVETLEELQDHVVTKDDLQKTVAQLKEEMLEERYRIIKRNNLIVFGLSENRTGEELLRKLLNILSPDGEHGIEVERVGESGVNDKARPVRLLLPNAIVKRRMMKNLKNLKPYEEFKKVQVVQDLTRNQQKAKTAEYKKKLEEGGGRAKRQKRNDESRNNQEFLMDLQ